jgi:hypothetical protein
MVLSESERTPPRQVRALVRCGSALMLSERPAVARSRTAALPKRPSDLQLVGSSGESCS